MDKTGAFCYIEVILTERCDPVKKIKMLLSLLLCAALLTACGGGDISEVGRQMGESERYTKAEISRAMDQVEDHFRNEFDGCKLLDLRYDEGKTRAEAEGWAQQYGADEAIVLYSDFEVDSSGGDGSLNPDSTYRNWKWVLIRNRREAWELKTWGYG